MSEDLFISIVEYRRPNGYRFESQFDCGTPETYAKAQAIIAAAYCFEAEQLSTGEKAVTIGHKPSETDRDVLIIPVSFSPEQARELVRKFIDDFDLEADVERLRERSSAASCRSTETGSSEPGTGLREKRRGVAPIGASSRLRTSSTSTTTRHATRGRR